MIPYLNVANRIETAITRGDYQDKLPRINELCELYQVGPSTVKRALRQLKEQDYIQGFRGRCIAVNPAASGNFYFRKNVAVYAELHKFGNLFYMRVLQKLGERFGEIGCRMSIVNTMRHLRDSAAAANAVIMIEPHISEVVQAEEICGPDKLLLLNRDNPRRHYVGSDNHAAGFMAMQYLHGELGHRRIAIMGEQCDWHHSFDQLRVEGAQAYAATHPDLTLFVRSVPASDDVQAEVTRLMAAESDITAFFLLRDAFALGAYNYCQEKHLDIPGDISVLGFDNRDFGAMLHPTLSTFQEDGAEITEVTFAQTLRIIRGDRIERSGSSIPPLLLQRESCAAAQVFAAARMG